MPQHSHTPDLHQHDRVVLKQGSLWGLAGLAGGLAAASALSRSWAPFRRLNFPQKSLAVISTGTLSTIIGADRASRQFEEHSLRAMGVEFDDDSGLEDEKLSLYQSSSSRARMLDHFKANKYQYVLGGWAVSMVGSFGFIATQPLSFTQKLVQARVYAQGLTVAVILASAALASIPSSEDDQIGAQEKRDAAMYKFKRDSPHEVHERHIREFRNESQVN